MKTTLHPLARLFAGALLFALALVAQARDVSLFNNNWRYQRGDYPEASSPTYDDSHWERVGLPHSFSIPYFMARDFYVGYGWYRKELCLTADDLSQWLCLDFDGVFQQAEVYVNGQLAAHHTGGYTGFRVALSPYVHEGTNLIAVRVNNLWRANVAPRAGEHTFSGGIYRNVRLVKLAPLHVSWYGTRVTTPGLQDSHGTASPVCIETELYNADSHDLRFTLEHYVADSQGRRVSNVVSRRATAPAGQSTTLVMQTHDIKRPMLWSPEHPSMYHVVTVVRCDGHEVDRYETPFGFRWLEWTADRGFFLNGCHRYLRGANVHQDQAGWGDAATDSAAARDVKQIHEAGFDFIRGSHYPHSPAFVEACDHEGMLFWSEAPFWGIGGFKPDGFWDSSAYPVYEADRDGFETSAIEQLRDMIRIHRNHPSVIAWSMSNEPFFSSPEVMDRVRNLLRRMVDSCHHYDATRVAAIGGAQRPLDEGRIDRIGDVAGYNGDGATQPAFQQPGVASLVSEYGSTTAERPGEFGPGWGDLQRDDTWRGYPWRSGQAIWCGFDHGSIAGSALGKMGIIDYFRIPKRSWYWYRQTYRGIAAPQWPVAGTPARLQLTATKTGNIRADGTDDARLDITVHDSQGRLLNATPQVTLTVLSGPAQLPTGRELTFAPDSDIRILDGQAAIAVRAYYAGESLIEATAPGLEPARLRLTFTDGPAWVEGHTPTMTGHPYVRYVAQEDATPDEQTFGYNNPAFASSILTGSAAGLATDGNAATSWQPATDDASPYWMLDAEKELLLREVNLRFPTKGIYHFTVEVSADRTHWLTVADQASASGEQPREAYTVRLLDPQLKGRYVRISFVRTPESTPVALAEVSVKGIVCE